MPKPITICLFALLLVALCSCGEEGLYTTSDQVFSTPDGRNYVCKIDPTDPVVARANHLKSIGSIEGLQGLLDSVSGMGEPNWSGYVLYSIGLVYNKLGDEKKYAYYRKAHTELAEGDPLILGRFLQMSINVGNNFLNEPGKEDSLINYARMGLRQLLDCTSCELENNKAVELYELAGKGLYSLGDYGSAQYFMDNGLEVNENHPPAYWRSGRLLRSSALLNIDLDDRKLSEIQAKRSERYFLEAKMDKLDSNYLADTYDTFVRIADKKADWKAFEIAARKSLLLNQDNRPGSYFMGNSYNNLGLGLIRQGNYKAGEENLKKALRLYQFDGVPMMKGSSYENYAESQLLQGDTLIALTYLDSAELAYHGYAADRSLAAAIDKEELKDPLMTNARLSWQWHLALAKIDGLRYELSPRRVSLNEIRYRAARVDSIIGLLQYRVRSEFSKRQNTKELRSFYEELITFGYKYWRKTGDEDYLNLAQEYLESSKARILRERQQRTFARLKNGFDSGNDAVYLAESKVKRLQGQLKPESKKSEAERLKIQADLQRAEFELRGRKDAAYRPGEIGLETRNGELNLNVIREQLSPGQAVLDYFVGDQAVFLSYATAEKKGMLRLEISPQELQKLIVDLQTDLAAPDGSDLRWNNNKAWRDSKWMSYLANANKLYDVLLAPVVARLPSKSELTIIPDGLLTYVPFGALLSEMPATETYDPFAKLPFAVHRYTINYEFSTGIWKDRLASGYSSGGKQLLVAPSQQEYSEFSVYGIEESIKLPPLESDERERQAISKYLSPKLLLGPEAATFARQPNLSGYDIIHFTGHGVAFPDKPQASFLALDTETPGEAKLLQLPDLENMQLNIDLLVLSACQTAVGEVATEEGVISLARAGTLAGARSVISTLWYVNQEAKAQMFDTFYQQLAAGDNRVEALRSAQLKLLSNPANAHPYFWAGFMNTGSGNAVAID